MKQTKEAFNVLKTISFTKRLPSISVITILFCMGLAGGCNYYKVNTIEPIAPSSITAQAADKSKYIVLHQAGIVWHLNEISVDNSQEKITGTLETLASSHQYYKSTKKNKANFYKSNKYKTDLPIHEIHIYTSQDSFATPGSQVTIPFSSITKIEVYDPDVGSTVLSVFGVTIAVVAVLVIVIALTKSSCPFVYTNNNSEYKFAGEMYGGAIYPSLERDDYMPLPGYRPTGSNYQLRISNELLERQYTNLAKLVVAEHPDKVTVLLDKHGQFQTITAPKNPFEVKSGTGVDCLESVSAKDSCLYLFDHDTDDGRNLSSLIVKFKRPEDSASGKLIINAKNSFWLDYVYGKFNEQFGTYYKTFADQQKKVPARKHIQWSIEQNIPLSVYVETEAGWTFVDYINTIGPLASRDLVIPIDLSDVKGGDVRIKLECGAMFWEVDYIAVDFSENIPIKITEVSAISAVDEKGDDVTNQIAESDNKYLIQPDIGNVVTLKYPTVAADSGNSQTVFLHSRGYYEFIREYKNWPDITKLVSFKQKGSFTKFSKEQYDEFMQTDDLLVAALTQHNEN